MSNATVQRLGQQNLAGATDELFLKIYNGEVLTQYEINCVTQDKHTVKTISQGKSASFPATGVVVASYHTPGTEILGQTSPIGERIITIDDLLIAPVFIADIDEAKNHWDARSIYSKEAGLVLAQTMDRNVLQVGVLAARAAATVTGGNGGSRIVSANAKTSAADMAAAIFGAMQTFDEKNVPESSEKYTYVKPAQYYLLAQNKDLINKDWGGSGMYSEGTIFKIAGSTLVKTNQLPTTNVATGPTGYQGDFSTTAALVMTKAAVGTVKLLDLSSRMDYDPRRLGTLVVAKYAVGHGVLRPEDSVEVGTAALA